MLTPRQLEQLPFPIMRRANEFQNKIVEYIANDLGKFDELATMDDFDEVKTENIQKFNVYYQKTKKKYRKKIDKEIEDMILLYIIGDVLSKSETEKANIPYIPFKEDKYLNKITNETINQVQKDIKGTFNNLGFTEIVDDKVKTLSIEPTSFKVATKQQGFYQKIMDRTANDIFNKGVDYNTGIKNAIRTMTDNGIRDIQYPHHTDRIDVAVRRSVMTQTKSLSRKNEEHKANRLRLTTFEITWHPQHRPSHLWGGRRFSKVKTDEIDIQTGNPFLTEQELYEKYHDPLTGEVGTLEDWNCYHNIFYIYSFDEPMYSEKELDRKDKEQEETTTYKGKEYTQWQARERQREIERTIRNWRLRVKGYENAGESQADNLLRARARVMLWRKEYQNFNKAIGLTNEWERINYDDLGRVSPLGVNQVKELAEISTLGDKLKEI